jgi:hypothetical protein
MNQATRSILLRYRLLQRLTFWCDGADLWQDISLDYAYKILGISGEPPPGAVRDILLAIFALSYCLPRDDLSDTLYPFRDGFCGMPVFFPELRLCSEQDKNGQTYAPCLDVFRGKCADIRRFYRDGFQPIAYFSPIPFRDCADRTGDEKIALVLAFSPCPDGHAPGTLRCSTLGVVRE